MPCQIDTKRPCSSSSRAKNRYTRKEIEEIAKDCDFPRIKGVDMDSLCSAVIEKMKTQLKSESTPKTKLIIKKKIAEIDKANPVTKPFVDIKDPKKVLKVDVKKDKDKLSTPPKPHEALNLQPVDHLHPKQVMFNKFKEYFRNELLGYFDVKQPKFRVITAGGYGLKTLLETKHNIYGKVKTDDVDFTVSTWRSSMTPLECYQFWHQKLHTFFAQQEKPSDFTVKVINFGHSYVPVMNFHRDYVIMVSYKNDEFVDVAITNQRIKDEMIDKTTSLKAGIPVKVEDFYLKEFLSLLYMETVPGVNAFCYTKRNPITGIYSCKGAKDIDRSKLLCDVKKANRYAKYCQLIAEISVDKLKKMNQYQRDTYFKDLKEIITPNAKYPMSKGI